MGYYPYLARYLDALPVEGREVLEIGLGFGTVGQILARRDAHYHGADIAAGPVAMMRDRLRWLGKEADADVLQTSVLELPWDDGTFDLVVSIGCLHHTGDLPGAIEQVHRVLRPDGVAFLMLYNAHSFRQLVRVQLSRLRRDVRRLFGAFSGIRVESQNFDTLTPSFAGRTLTIPRERLLGNVARVLGLDLYIHARK